MRTLLTRGKRALIGTVAALMLVGMLPGVAQALTPNTTISIGPCDTLGGPLNPPTGCPSAVPADPVSFTTAAFEFFGTNGSGTFATCNLDGVPCTVEPANPSMTRFKDVWTGLAEGTHVLTVGVVGDPTPAVWTFDVDLTAPGSATITGAPPVLSNSKTATFVVAPPVPATEPVRLMCSLDDVLEPSSSWDFGPFDYQARRATSEIQTLTFSSGMVGNRFSLRSAGNRGTSIVTLSAPDYSSLTVEQVQAALDGIAGFSGNAIVAYGGDGVFSVSYVGFPGVDMPPLVLHDEIGGNTILMAPGDDALPAASGIEKAWEYDADTYVPCNSPKTFTNLAEGPHTMSVVAEDGAGNGGPVDAYQWRIDTVKPITTITGHPTLIMGTGDADFSFAANETEVTFECQIDSLGFVPCTSSTNYPGLLGGSHKFDVRATDEAGNVGDAASYTWTVDTTAPETTIVSGPTGPTNVDPPVFGFSSDDANATFECQLDGGGFTACNNPAEFPGLSQGGHTLDVRAVDPFLRVDASPATRMFTLDSVAPDTSIDLGPATPSAVSTATFEFSSADMTATFECRRDGSVWAACVSPKVYTGLSNADHTFDVRAVDLAGNADATPAAWAWTVAAPPPPPNPQTTIDSGPTGTVAVADAQFTFSADQAPVAFECKLDGAAFGPCSSPIDYLALTNGSHTFQVRATNTDTLAVDPSPASRTWTVDVPVPVSYRPDALVALRFGPYAGEDEYSDEVFHDATGQVKQANVRAGGSAVYNFRLENDGVDPDRFILKGCAPAAGPPGFKPKWSTGGNNVTNGISEGTHMTPVIAPGGFVNYRLVVSTTSAARNNYECNLRIDSNSDNDVYDINQARTHIR